MKTHVKLYKTKKKWVTALVVSGITMSMGLGIGIVNQSTDVSAITIDPVNKKLTQNKSVVQSVPMDTANTQIKNILLANDGTDENWSPSLPTQSGLYGNYSNSYANATIVSQNGKDYSIDYRIGPTTGQGTKYANYTKTSYASEKEAAFAVEDQWPGRADGNWSVPLGHGAIGSEGMPRTQNGISEEGIEWGQQNYLAFAYDRSVDGSINLAKKAVDQLSSENLPEPTGTFSEGVIILDGPGTSQANSLEQKIFIQQGSDVYTLSAHDPQTLITMAGSLRYI